MPSALSLLPPWAFSKHKRLPSEPSLSRAQSGSRQEKLRAFKETENFKSYQAAMRKFMKSNKKPQGKGTLQQVCGHVQGFDWIGCCEEGWARRRQREAQGQSSSAAAKARVHAGKAGACFEALHEGAGGGLVSAETSNGPCGSDMGDSLNLFGTLILPCVL